MSFKQNDPLFRNETIRVALKVGGYGCVAGTATNLVNRMRGTTFTILDVLGILRSNRGCLVDAKGNEPGDLVAWPAAARALGLVADDAIAAAPNHTHHELVDHTIDPNVDLVEALVEALSRGDAAVRVDIDGDGKGDHTIACYGRIADSGEFLCDCTALGRIINLDANLEGGPETSWGGARYRVVGVRGIRLPS